MKVVVAYGAAALVLIEAGNNILPLFGMPDSINRVLVWLALAGLPVAVFLAWKFDVVADPGVQPAHPAPPLDGDLPSERVAVLPFEDRSEGGTDEYFADGVAEDIIGKLAQIPSLSVVCRRSVMSLRGSELPLGAIGQQLRAGSIVEGTVRRSGDRVRVVAQLSDSNTDSTLWTETYDRELDDLFSVQSEIASSIARGLHASLSKKDKARLSRSRRGHPEAYDLYLRAMHLWNSRSVAGLRESRSLLEKSIDRDPQLAVAHAGLATVLATAGLYNLDPPSDVMPVALEAAERALASDPDMVEALNARGLIECIWNWEWDVGASTFERAAAASPSDAMARQWYAMNCLAPQGRLAEAKEALAVASSLDPLSQTVQASDGFLKYLSRDVEGAEGVLAPILEEADAPPIAHLFMGFVHELAGRHDLARRAFRTAEAVGGRTVEALSALATNRALAGDHGAAGKLLDEMVAISEERYVPPGTLARVRAAMGDWAGAKRNWEEAVRLRSADLIWVGVSPIYDFAKGRSEWAEVVEAVGAVRRIEA